MPASTLDPVNAALRSSLAKSTTSDNSLDSHLTLSTKKALLADIKFESSGTYNIVVDKIKSKYTTFKSTSLENQQNNSCKAEKSMGADETLTLAKYVLYPLESVQLGWSNADWTVGAGMVNMGNTCYLNSTLQALFHVPALVNWLISDRQHMAECEDSGNGCIICAMRKTLQDSQQRNANTIRPFLIYNKLRIVCRNLIPGRQEDAHEFLRYLVEAMEKAYLSRFKNHSEFDSRTKETTPLNQILGGYLRSAVRCLECSHVSTTFQHFQDLLLDIRKAQTLEEALDTYFSREKLDDESYQCEACHKKVPATKQFFLERAPMVLCIQLKRFSISNNKITKHVQFKQNLELTKYSKHKPPIPLVYRLVALVTHMGPTVSCGHYTAVAQAASGNFYQFDDSMVKPISPQAVFGTNAYIMLYELENSPFAQKSANLVNKLKNSTSCSSSSTVKSLSVKITSVSSSNSSNNITSINNNNKMNGTSVAKMYGPELPPVKPELAEEQNVSVQSIVNGIKKPLEQDKNKTESSVVQNNPPPNNIALQVAHKFKNNNINNSSTLVTNNHNSASNSIIKKEKDMPNLEANQENMTKKLVPYDMDDSSSCSEEFCSRDSELRVATKAGGTSEWKMTPTPGGSESTTHNTSEKKNWDKIKFQNDRTTVNELLRMSHSGYAAPVSSWNGTRAQLNKEISSERREERKRSIVDDGEEARVKHQKMNSNNTFKSNPGYNPIQEFHSAKNWNKNNGSYHNRQFFNNNRHRRNNFHHKMYHKNYRFRQ